MPKTHCASTMAGFIQTPPKIYRQTLMPNAHVVIAKMCPLPWYFVFVKTSSQCTPTPNKIISPVDKNSAIKLCNINSNFLPYIFTTTPKPSGMTATLASFPFISNAFSKASSTVVAKSICISFTS